MRLSLSAMLSQSWDDFKKLVVNPVILIWFIVYSSLSILSSFIPEELPVMALLFIPWVILLMIVYAYIIKIIYNFKKGETLNIFSEVLPLLPRYLWYTLIFMGIIILLTFVIAILGTILYFMMGKSVWVIVLCVLVYIPLITYISSRFFFYSYLIIIDKDKKPLAASWTITEQYFWKLILLFFMTIVPYTTLLVALELYFTEIQKISAITSQLIILPVNIIYSMYIGILFLNTFLFCNNQYRAKSIKEEILAGNE